MTNVLRNFRNQKTEISSEVTEEEPSHPGKQEQRIAGENTRVTPTVDGERVAFKTEALQTCQGNIYIVNTKFMPERNSWE